MRLLFRATLALVGVCCAFSTSQAFWWHHKGGGHHASDAAAGYGVGSCATGTCGAPTVSYVPETRDVAVTRYRQEVRMVPETVIQKVTTMVPVVSAPRIVAAPSGCHGVTAGASCHGVTAGASCYGGTAGASCHGAPGVPGSYWQYGPSERSSADPMSPRLTQLEARILALETKITTLAESVNSFQTSPRIQDKATITIPALPTPGAKPADAVPVGTSPARDADPLAAAARAFKEGAPGATPDGNDDRLLAAARAFKARQAGAQASPATPAVGPTTAAARLAAGSP